MAIKASDVVNLATSCIGIDKRKVIDAYNAHKPLASGYSVKYTDAWCDTFLSYLFIKLNAVDLIGGTECGVERHIQIFKMKGIWNEDGTITPPVGAIICYNWDDNTQPNDGFADHIGIVEKVEGRTIHTIEGNTGGGGGRVDRCWVPLGDGNIRGFALPKYSPETSVSHEKPKTESKNSPGGNFGKTVSKVDITKPIIDVSEWQREIDWEKVKPQIGGAIIRVAYGTKKTDDFVTRNLDECDRLGIPYGVYIYSLAFSEAMAKEEAAKVLGIIKGRKLSLPAYVDLEETKHGWNAKAVAKAFCEYIAASSKYGYGVYSGEYYFNNFIKGASLPNASLWIARYNKNDGSKGNKPSIGMPYDAWQYTSVGKIAGINGNVDMNEFFKTFDGSPAASTPAPKVEAAKSIDVIAKEVIDGKWGNGEERIKRLTAAGYNAGRVQEVVNQMLGGAPKHATYVVQPGDTLSGIASKFNTTYLKIAADNGITNPNRIYPGQELIIK